MGNKLRRRGIVDIDGERYEWEEGSYAFLVDGTGEVVSLKDAYNNGYVGEVITVDTSHPASEGATYRFFINKYAVNPSSSYSKPYSLKNYSPYTLYSNPYSRGGDRKMSAGNVRIASNSGINTNAGGNNGRMLYIRGWNDRPANGSVRLE